MNHIMLMMCCVMRSSTQIIRCYVQMKQHLADEAVF